MIRKLPIKFIAISMTSTIIVLFLILGSINLLNYREMSHNADTILDFLKENDGELPENLYKSQHKKTNGISPETSFESRYFSVFLSNNRQRCEADTDNISAIDEETAIKYAQKINRSNKNCGFISKYRYMKENTSNGVKIYFLDCTKSMMSFQTFLVTSFFVSIFGVSTVFILVVLLSKRAIEPVAESYEKQKSFVENASHELRTPLAVLQNRLESLFRRPDATILDNSESIAASLDEVRNMRILTTNLLNLARRDDGLKVELEDIQPATFNEIFENYDMIAEENGKTFIGHNLAERPIKSDRTLLKQLMTILFDNAIKYTDDDGVIEFTVKTTDKQTILTVADNGPGISDADKVKIFDRFYRVDKARTRQKGGFGLGLSLAKQIVDVLKGDIQVKDNQPKGTIFEVRFNRH